MKNNCCQPLYDDTFDQKSAKQQLKEYLKSGVRKSSRPIIKAIQHLHLEDKTLVDIGGGIGTISFELFKKRIKKSTHVDISNAYIQTFQAEAKRRGLGDKVEVKQGDFLDFVDEIEPADIVTLDKVICCYDDYESLVRTSSKRANRWYVYTIPRNVWWVRLVHQVGERFNKIRGKAFRSFIHPPDAIEHLVLDAGFRKIYQANQREWQVVLFEKD